MKSIRFLIFVCTFMFFASAQVNAQLGIKAGYNLSSLKYFTDADHNFNEQYISGYQIGLVYRVGLGDKLSIQPEAAYYTTGGKSDFFTAEVSRIYRYGRLSGLVNYNVIGNNDGISLHATGGFYASYAINASLDIGQGAQNLELSDQDIYERTNYGYILGAGIKVNRFVLSVRGSIGINEMINTEVIDIDGSLTELTLKSREFSLVGVFLF